MRSDLKSALPVFAGAGLMAYALKSSSSSSSPPPAPPIALIATAMGLGFVGLGLVFGRQDP